MKKWVIAHRGASAYARENTLSAFKLAIEQGADMIEFDVRKTKDNVLISYHDDNIEDESIPQLSYRDISARAKKNGFEIPTLENILEFTRGKIKLNVELKEEGYEKTVLKMITRYFQDDEFIITSFSDFSLNNIKNFSPQTKVGLILGKNKPSHFFKTRFSEIFPLNRYKQTGSDYLILHKNLIKFGILSRVTRKNIPVIIWTLNKPQKIKKFLKDNRVIGIITDRPDLAISLNRQLNSFLNSE